MYVFHEDGFIGRMGDVSFCCASTRGLLAVLFTIVFGASIAGCGTTSHLDSPHAGKTVAYAPGLPNFDMELVPTRLDGSPGITLNLGVPYRSLIYVRRGESYVAEYELTTQVYDEDGSHIVRTGSWTDSLTVADYALTRAYELLSLNRRINLPPGTYVFRVVLRDVTTEQQASRLKRVVIPQYAAEAPVLGHLHTERIERGQAAPIVALHMPSNLDSLRAITELYNADAYDEIDIRMSVLRFDTDGDVATPPYWITPFAGSLSYQGVDYNESDTVTTSRYSLENLSPQVRLRFRLPPLERGVYRVSIEAALRRMRSAPDSVVLQQSREISVKGSDFPSLAELGDVVDALQYITRKRELSHIRDAATVEERRRRFDAFWGELVGDRQEARRLLRSYYSRVEEANLFFTSHKEGWKTDRGMVYVVMGAPLYVESYADAEIWYYSYGTDPDERFVFERVDTYYSSEPGRLNNFVLLRRPYYERTWDRAVRRWRDGRAL